MGAPPVTPPTGRHWARWAAAAGLAIVFLPGWWRAYQLRVRAARLDAEITLLDAENRRLLAEMQRLQDDPTYLERVAHRKLGRARKGEVIYKVAPPAPDSSAVSR